MKRPGPLVRAEAGVPAMESPTKARALRPPAGRDGAFRPGGAAFEKTRRAMTWVARRGDSPGKAGGRRATLPS